jgi:hypothetical protein
MQPKLFSTDYTYHLLIEPSATLSNVSIIVPLPLLKDRPTLGTKMLTEDLFKSEGYKVSFIKNNELYFLKITTDKMALERRDKYRINIFDNRPVFDVKDFANTRYPLGNESVFQPKYDLTSKQPSSPTYSTWYGDFHNPVISLYRTTISADYSAENDSTVLIIADIDVLNQWVESGTHISNSFHDSYSITLYGESHGWYFANGTLETGKGKYLGIKMN